ncbi:hypothetical protein GCM10009069_05950 [Algimonas arctica]|uniref:S9 family peptidase n=1 Tax=Algimonas arctica TaxID=1479486 RepID=A0A8J3CQC9_9PROT|nr:hypothetical protein [Algimonas arctica]GHA85568.1 hypothetical protein GCM10009069_05950 [Algimonas arctica]
MGRFKLGLATLVSAALIAVSTGMTVAAAPDAAQFGQLPAGYDAAISPDGTRVAIIRAVNGEYVVQIVSLDGESLDDNGALTLGEGAKPKWIKWANNDRVFVSLWGSVEVGGTRRTTGSRL